LIRCSNWACRKTVKTPKEALEQGWGYVENTYGQTEHVWRCSAHLKGDEETDVTAAPETQDDKE
jgi:hypothetical protein